MNNSIFEEYTPEALKRFSLLYPVNEKLTLQALKYYRGDKTQRENLREFQTLEQRWYQSLERGEPDYSVYDDPAFVSDLWSCWVIYSRKYLLAIRKQLMPKLKSVKRICDLGCGIGYTTAGLKEMFPAADVYGVDIYGSPQYQIATKLGKTRGFSVESGIKSETDLIFASEYFEHIERPIEVMWNIAEVAQPTFLIFANSFNTTSLGHFKTYWFQNQAVEARLMSRQFNSSLRFLGYARQKTKFWNNRPAFWKWHE